MAAYQIIPVVDGESCRMHVCLLWSIAANALEYSEVPLIFILVYLLLLRMFPRVIVLFDLYENEYLFVSYDVNVLNIYVYFIMINFEFNVFVTV